MNAASPRKARISRQTAETAITLDLCLDGSADVRVATGFGMADHMITLLAFWAGFDLDLSCSGDLHVDAHHTLEDAGICLGQGLGRALGDKARIARTGFARVPMDEALAEVSLDLSGRPFLVYRGQEWLPAVIAGEESDLWREFFKSLAAGAGMNLHIAFLYGQNGHHLLESACKGLGLALSAAVARTRSSILSTKGSLD
ncbi:MAG: imidazoleglycerol-phosphate dehydratase HisB [Desulfovibrio sp.]|jgi:imidazoleglycerol-phosphate dehydratase|nr:imidazoleglycerol-phosphate dehydratase HisB [Desulfovibrio sp.]